MKASVSFVSLGCDKNTVDSEIMLSMLLDHGYTLEKDEAKADVIIVNTCGFIQDAKEESIQTLIEMGQYKTTGSCRKLIATGCLAQRYAEEIREDLPEVDAVVGTGSYEKIVQVIDGLLERESEGTVEVLDPLPERDLGYHRRLITTTGYYEYLKIAEGCDNHCTYCIIPKLRGPYRSREAEDIVREAEELAADGVTELMIVAQDITKYGRDLNPRLSLSDLLKRLCRVEGLHWIRLLYCYPEDITDELIETMAAEPKIVPYIDMPIQHASNTVLKRMGRRHTKEMLYQVIGKLREKIPRVCIRTTLIAGFPGETEEEFEELCDFVDAVRFDRLGVFAYSREEGTPAAKMKGQIPKKIKERRRDLLMQHQQSISRERSGSYVGEVLEVLIEGEIPQEEETHVYSARSYRDAPDIDGFVFLSSDRRLRSGEYVRCRVTGAYEYDLIAEEIQDEEDMAAKRR